MCAFGAIVRSRCIGPFRPASGRRPAPLGSRGSGWAVVPPSRGGFAEAPQAVIVHVFEWYRYGGLQVRRWGEIMAAEVGCEMHGVMPTGTPNGGTPWGGTCRGGFPDLGADEVLRCRLRDLHEFEGPRNGVAAVGLRPADDVC